MTTDKAAAYSSWRRVFALLAIGLLAAAHWPQTLGADGLRIVQVSDIHASHTSRNRPPRFLADPKADDLVHSLDILRAAVERINTDLRPDLVVVTGDLVDSGKDLESLREVKTWLDRLTCPYYPVIGNHDQPATYQQVFPGPLDYVVQRGEWRFVALDSHSGRLSADSLNWLETQLSANQGHPTVVMLHHPLLLNPIYDVLGGSLYHVRLRLENARRPCNCCRSTPTYRWCSPGTPTSPISSSANTFFT